MKDKQKSELERMYKVCDMLVTAHYERGRSLKRISLYCELTIVTLSAILTIFAFSDVCDIIKSEPLCSKIEFFLPYLAPSIFIFTIVLIKLNLRGIAQLHLKVAEMLIPMKSQISDLKDDVGFTEEKYNHLRDKYNIISSSFVTIPDNLFPKYKKAHRAKISISKEIDKYPNVPLIILKFKLILFDIISCIFSRKR